MIRPEDIGLRNVDAATAQDNGWKGNVVAGAYLGEAVDYVVAVDSAEFRCRTSPLEKGWVDKDVYMTVDPQRVHVLPPERGN
jgi:iron(III) transport system ATP-binding protein